MQGSNATIIDDVIYIGGGECPGADDEYYIFMYHQKENRWTRLQARLPQHGGVIININNKLTVLGGMESVTNISTNKVLTLQNNRWISLYSDMNTARYKPAALSYQHYTIVAGGKDNNVVLNTIEVFNLSNNQWTISKTFLPTPMWIISATTSYGAFIIAGHHTIIGCSNTGAYITTLDNILKPELSSTSSADDNKWIVLAAIPYWNATIVPQTTPPVIVGGHDDQFNTTDAIMVYDDSINIWKTVSVLPLKCCRTTMVTTHNSIIMAGGVTEYKTPQTIKSTTLTTVMIGNLVEQ